MHKLYYQSGTLVHVNTIFGSHTVLLALPPIQPYFLHQHSVNKDFEHGVGTARLCKHLSIFTAISYTHCTYDSIKDPNQMISLMWDNTCSAKLTYCQSNYTEYSHNNISKRTI